MPMALPLLVFTDLDGTLIDHDTYSHAPARPALATLAQIGAGVVLASSKTAVELAALRRDLALQAWPAIVENGAGLLPAEGAATGSTDDRAYTRLRATLGLLPPDLRAQFQGFGDLSVAQVAEITGLPHTSAALAKTRQFSEPGLWSGDDETLQTFLSALAQYGITARRGGRFLTLSFGGTKADQMAGIIAKHAPRQTIALGDAPNDVEMLQAADYGVIIANPHSPSLPFQPGEAEGRIRRTLQVGPVGWNSAIHDLLSELQLT